MMKRLFLLLPLLCLGCAANTRYVTTLTIAPAAEPENYYVQAAVREFRANWYSQRLRTFATESVLVQTGKETLITGAESEDKAVFIKAYLPAKDDKRPAGVTVELRHKDELLNSTRVLLPLKAN